jgi:hypothetical protein
MGINSDHIIGFLLGLGGAALGHHLYKKNKEVIDSMVSDFVPQPKTSAVDAITSLNLEQLTLLKEQLEDLIAEKEAAEEKSSAGKQKSKSGK